MQELANIFDEASWKEIPIVNRSLKQKKMSAEASRLKYQDNRKKRYAFGFMFTQNRLDILQEDSLNLSILECDLNSDDACSWFLGLMAHCSLEIDVEEFFPKLWLNKLSKDVLMSLQKAGLVRSETDRSKSARNFLPISFVENLLSVNKFLKKFGYLKEKQFNGRIKDDPILYSEYVNQVKYYFDSLKRTFNEVLFNSGLNGFPPSYRSICLDYNKLFQDSRTKTNYINNALSCHKTVVEIASIVLHILSEIKESRQIGTVSVIALKSRTGLDSNVVFSIENVPALVTSESRGKFSNKVVNESVTRFQPDLYPWSLSHNKKDSEILKHLVYNQIGNKLKLSNDRILQIVKAANQSRKANRKTETGINEDIKMHLNHVIPVSMYDSTGLKLEIAANCSVVTDALNQYLNNHKTVESLLDYYIHAKHMTSAEVKTRLIEVIEEVDSQTPLIKQKSRKRACMIFRSKLQDYLNNLSTNGVS